MQLFPVMHYTTLHTGTVSSLLDKVRPIRLIGRLVICFSQILKDMFIKTVICMLLHKCSATKHVKKVLPFYKLGQSLLSFSLQHWSLRCSLVIKILDNLKLSLDREALQQSTVTELTIWCNFRSFYHCDVSGTTYKPFAFHNNSGQFQNWPENQLNKATTGENTISLKFRVPLSDLISNVKTSLNSSLVWEKHKPMPLTVWLPVMIR